MEWSRGLQHHESTSSTLRTTLPSEAPAVARRAVPNEQQIGQVLERWRASLPDM